MRRPHRLLLLTCVAGVAAVAGCGARVRAVAPNPAPIPASRTGVAPLEPRVDAILGRTLVIPVSVTGPVDPKRPVAVRLEDGRRPECGLCWVCASAGAEGTGWLPEGGAWSATPIGAERRPSERGFWALVIDMPLDSVGQGVWVGDARIVINWLPDPGSLEGSDELWRPPLGQPSAGLLRMVEGQAHSPLTRWRHHLLTTGLRPDTRAPLEQDVKEPVTGASDVFPDPVIEALARQTEARWQVGLASLWLADPELAQRLRRRLVAAVDFGAGVVAPAWPAEDDALRSLLTDLTNPRLNPARKRERAANWLESQPAGAAWVIDDAGVRDGVSGATVSTVGVANLTERGTLSWPSLGGWNGGEALTPVESLGVARLSVSPPVREEGIAARGPVRPLEILVHAGGWSATCPVVQGKLASAPPGVRLEPMALDWTMRSFLAGEPGAEMMPGRDWATAALLYRDAAPPERAREGRGACWWLYAECRVPRGQDVTAERLRVWVGPRATPLSVVRVTAAGSAIDERAGLRGRPFEVEGATVVREEDRWMCRVPLPDNITDPDGAVRVAIERVDAAGRRSTFPRPQLPWQTEPGRVLIDTATWDRR